MMIHVAIVAIKPLDADKLATDSFGNQFLFSI